MFLGLSLPIGSRHLQVPCYVRSTPLCLGRAPMRPNMEKINFLKCADKALIHAIHGPLWFGHGPLDFIGPWIRGPIKSSGPCQPEVVRGSKCFVGAFQKIDFSMFGHIGARPYVKTPSVLRLKQQNSRSYAAGQFLFQNVSKHNIYNLNLLINIPTQILLRIVLDWGVWVLGRHCQEANKCPYGSGKDFIFFQLTKLQYY